MALSFQNWKTLPRIVDIFGNLAAAGEKFTKIDVRQVHLQRGMKEDSKSKKYLTVNTHKGLHQYNRLLVGVASAPADWERLIDQILQNIPGTQVILNDIIITGETDLVPILERQRDYYIRAEITKCEFFKESITYWFHWGVLQLPSCKSRAR